MKPILTIAKRELVSYFTSPVAYVFLVIFLLLTGFFTFTAGNFFERGEASLAASSAGTRGCTWSSCRRSACGCGPRSAAPARLSSC